MIRRHYPPILLALIVSLLLLRSGEAQQVIFSEIMYNPPAELPEYIEVQNNTATPYDIALWELSGGVNYTFPNFDSSDPERSFLKAFERILLSSVPEDALREAYPDIPAATRIYGPWDGIDADGTRVSGNLNNAGERLTLKNKNDSLICSMAYDDDPAFWPVAADGNGHSLQVANPNLKIDDWRNWRASAAHGGSPGSADAEAPLATIRLSEAFFDADGNLAWVELHNGSNASVSLADHHIQVPGFAEPLTSALSGTIAPDAYLAVDVAFDLAGENDLQLILVDGSQNVLSAYAIENADTETAYQRYPAHSVEWYRTATASKGAANDPERNDHIVINEIMFSPMVGQIGEYLELHNNSDTAVDLSGWEFTEGVSFDFPQGTMIAPRGYVVVAADAQYIEENYEGITAVGSFENGLSNHGETLRLVDADGNLADQVSYSAGGEWPELADELGSSLELAHPDLDNNRGSAWRDSDESEKGAMREYTISMPYNSQGVWHPSNDDELHFHLVGEGYLVLKDVHFGRETSLFNPNGESVLENADQQSVNSRSNTGWVFQGTHAFGFYQDGEVHIKATGRGDNRANRVEIDTQNLGTSGTYELTFQGRWVYGKPRLIAQTSDHAWSHEFLLDVPTNLGTPGSANSMSMATAPPQIDGLRHSPAVPTDNQDVTITAHVSAPGGLANVQVAYIDDAEGGNQESLFRRWKRNPMVDDGTNGDAVAGDGIYTGVITDMKVNGRIVVFYVEAETNDGLGFQYPTGGWENPAMYVVDTPEPTDQLRTVRAVVAQQDLDRIRNGLGSGHDGKFPRSSNHYWNGTIIYNESEIFYNAVIRSAGSPWHTGDRANLGLKGKWKMPKSRAWRGRIKTTYDQDPTSGRAHNDRVIRYWLYLLGHKINDNEFIEFAVNAGSFNVREEVEAPNTNDFMRRVWGENGHKGQMFRIDDEWDFGDSLDNQRNNRDADWNYKSPNGHRPGRYHSEYMLRSQETAYDYTSLIDGFRLLTDGDYTQEEAGRYFDIQMIALNAAARGYIHDWDFQTLNRGKNTFFYRRLDGLFQYVHWDSDLAFRTGDLNAAFATGRGTTLNRFLNQPWFERWFKFYLNDLSENYADKSARFQTWLDLEDNSTTGQGVDENRYLTWGERRRSAVRRELGSDASASFAVTTNGGNDFSSQENRITLEGTAAVDVYEVFIEGHPEAEIHWTDTVAYEMRGIILKEGENVLNVRARDRDGNELGSLFNPLKDTITVTKTTPSQPIADIDFQPASLNVSLGQQLEIDASASWDPEGDALSFAFGGPSGSSLAVDGSAAVAVFDQPGIYPITVTITDANGHATEVMREVSVYGGGPGFDNFSGRRVESYWQTERAPLQTTTFQSSFHSVGDPEGMLAIEVMPDSAKSLAGDTFPVVWRPLPETADFSFQTKVVLTNLQFGPFQTGLLAEIDGGKRYAFGLKDGRQLVVSEIDGSTVTELAAVEHPDGRATLRVRRGSGQWHFEARADNAWFAVHAMPLSADVSATRGGLFVASEESLRARVLFDYAMLVDTGLISDLQRDLRLTEIMYNPADGEDLEYLEMQNIGSSTLDLTGARFTDGIDFTFPAISLNAGEFIVVAKDPTALGATYNVTDSQVVGGYGGQLANGGETIELVDASDRLIFTFTYGDTDPWPAEADGQGYSLELIDTAASANDAGNWQASGSANGTPGTGSGDPIDPQPGDADGDGLPDAWETANGLNANDASDAERDLDGDGQGNLEEYWANTDPNNPASLFTLRVMREGGVATIHFTQQVERQYTVEYTDDLASDQWQALETIAAGASSDVTSEDTTAATVGVRFYRVRAALP